VPHKIPKIFSTDRPTLRGLTTGSVKINRSTDNTKCVVVCQSYPSWVFVLGELGLDPQWVHAEVVTQVVPTGCKILSGNPTEMSSLLGDHARVKLGLIDGALTSSLSALFEGLGVRTVYYTQRMRRRLPGWNNFNACVQHASVGGVTLRTLRFGVLGKAAVGRPLFGPPVAPRDVSTVLSVMPQHHGVRKAPECRHLTDFGCTNLGNTTRPIYHGGGWLPATVTPSTRVLTPGIYAPKGTWALRPLTFGEYLSAHDVPETLIRRLRDNKVLGANASLASLVPGKCLVAGFRLFNGGGDRFLDLDRGFGDKGLGNKECLADLDRDLGDKCWEDTRNSREGFTNDREDSSGEENLKTQNSREGPTNETEDSSGEKNLETRGEENSKTSTPNSREVSTRKNKQYFPTARVNDCPSATGRLNDCLERILKCL
jgi:hypothetical protein